MKGGKTVDALGVEEQCTVTALALDGFMICHVEKGTGHLYNSAHATFTPVLLPDERSTTAALIY